MPKYTVVRDLRYQGRYYRSGDPVELPERVARRYVVKPYEEPKSKRKKATAQVTNTTGSPEGVAQVDSGEAPAVTIDKDIGPQDTPAPENTPGNE